MSVPPAAEAASPVLPAARLASALLLSGMALGSVACGGDAGDRDGAGDAEVRNPRGDSAAARGGAATSGEGGGPAADSGRSGADSLAERGPRRAFRVRIRNGGRDTAVVSADAGAGARTLDTVPPADSSEVRVETRAVRLEIRARRPNGLELARSRYELSDRPVGDSVLNFHAQPTDTTGD